MFLPPALPAPPLPIDPLPSGWVGYLARRDDLADLRQRVAELEAAVFPDSDTDPAEDRR